MMWSGKHSVISPRGFRQKLTKFASHLGGYSPQDPCMFFMSIVDFLHEDFNQIMNKPCTIPISNENIPDLTQCASQSWKMYEMRNKSMISDTFGGQMMSTVQCPKCLRRVTTFDPYFYVSLPFGKDDKSLDDLFHTFCKEEILTQDNTWYCRKCKEHVLAKLKKDFWNIPSQFVLQLKIFKTGTRTRVKVSEPITIPLILNMSSHVGSTKSPVLYRLCSIVVHYGVLGGGHVLCYARSFSKDELGRPRTQRTPAQWHKYDDSLAQTMTRKELEEIASGKSHGMPWMLFYEEVGGRQAVMKEEKERFEFMVEMESGKIVSEKGVMKMPIIFKK